MKTDNLIAVIPPPTQPKPVPAAHDDGWGDEEETTGFAKWRTPLIVAVLSVAGVYAVGKKLMNADGSAAKKDATAMMVQVLPPPPIAPLPPPPPPKEEVREDKQVEEKEEQEPEPEPAVTTAASGKGAGGITIAKGKGGGFFRKSADAGAQTKWRGFAGQVARSIEDALRRNPASKHASGTAPVVRVWVDSGGRITRVALDSSTGNAALDGAINESLAGTQCPGITPEDMPQPIRMRISLRRPN